MRKAIKISLIMILFYAACAKNYNPKLVEYLKAEKELRQRVAPANGLDDSIKVLQKKYPFNLQKEIAMLQQNPELWIKLIKELKSEE